MTCAWCGQRHPDRYCPLCELLLCQAHKDECPECGNEDLTEFREDQKYGRDVERFELVARHYRLLMKTTLTPGIFRKLVLDVVAPDPRQRRDWNPEAKMAEAVVARHERKVAEVTRLWFEGKGHTGEPTAWFALNGCIEAIDYNRDLWPTRSGCYRTASLLTGELAAMKARVTDGLVAYASQGADFAMAG